MKSFFRLLLKITLFIAVLLLAYPLTAPLNKLNRLSLYNRIFPGRERLPFGETPRTAYNFTLDSLDAMMASHKLCGAKEKAEGTYRVIVIGDSSVWGTLLRPEETLAGQLNGRSLSDGRTIEAYNLGYPTLSLAKDLLLLNRALSFEPDLIIWSQTLESFPKAKQSENDLVKANIEEFNGIADKIGIELLPIPEETPYTVSLFGQRRALADWLRLQLYGVLWAGTDIDQDYPADYPAASVDLSDETAYYGMTAPLSESSLAWDILEGGTRLAGEVPLLLLNEPMLISSGDHSEIRYNFYYPRAVYDDWHEQWSERCETNGRHCLDLWDALENERFTNSAIHYDAQGAALLSERIIENLPIQKELP